MFYIPNKTACILNKAKIICSVTDGKPFVACGFCGVKISPVIGNVITTVTRSSLLQILEVCSASVRKSLQGLDYITATGSKAFEDLENVVNQLGDLRMGVSWTKRQTNQLKLTKRYLKSDFKVI